MLEIVVVVSLVVFTTASTLFAINQYLKLIKGAGLDLPWERPRRDEQPTWKYSSKTTKKIPCPVPFPICGPDDCPQCGGKGYTEE
jgi:hypothetical protein